MTTVVKSEPIRPQYWRVTLTCGHTQEVHSVRDGGPLFVRRCQTCERKLLDKEIAQGWASR